MHAQAEAALDSWVTAPGIGAALVGLMVANRYGHSTNKIARASRLIPLQSELSNPLARFVVQALVGPDQAVGLTASILRDTSAGLVQLGLLLATALHGVEYLTGQDVSAEAATTLAWIGNGISSLGHTAADEMVDKASFAGEALGMVRDPTADRASGTLQAFMQTSEGQGALIGSAVHYSSDKWLDRFQFSRFLNAIFGGGFRAIYSLLKDPKTALEARTTPTTLVKGSFFFTSLRLRLRASKG